MRYRLCMTGTADYADDLPAPAIAPEGWPVIIAFIIGSGLITGLAAWLTEPIGAMAAGLVTVALLLWCVWFFRDPKRRIPVRVDGAEVLVSPADGVVSFVGPALPPAEVGLSEDDRRGLTRVSVFMNVFNVHVNRAPIAGIVEKIAYKPGKFVNAAFDKASDDNERSSLVLRRGDGSRLVCVQIAGLIARRIVCRVKEGTMLATGERYGMIRFGSRVDVYVPRGITPLVKVGDKCVAGETVLAALGSGAGAESNVRAGGGGATGNPAGGGPISAGVVNVG